MVTTHCCYHDNHVEIPEVRMNGNEVSGKFLKTSGRDGFRRLLPPPPTPRHHSLITGGLDENWDTFRSDCWIHPSSLEVLVSQLLWIRI